MPAVSRRRSICLLLAVPAAVAIGSPPALAAGEGPSNPAKALKPAQLSVHVHGVRNGKVKVGKKVRAVGYLRPFVRGQHVQVSRSARRWCKRRSRCRCRGRAIR